jgi:hypothetical protein
VATFCGLSVCIVESIFKRLVTQSATFCVPWPIVSMLFDFIKDQLCFLPVCFYGTVVPDVCLCPTKDLQVTTGSCFVIQGQTILHACILKTRINPLVLRVHSNFCRRMPLFNSTAIAASFKATSTLTTPNTTNGNNAKKNQNSVETNKCKLVKQEVPTGMTVLRLVLPTTEDSYYTDMPDTTTAQALEVIMESLS